MTYKETKNNVPPIVVDGHEFYSWKVGIGSFQRRTDDGRMRAWLPSYKATFNASVDGEIIGKRFMTELAAITACVKAFKARAKG